MSVIIRLQNLPWSANALDIRNFFRGLSIPEGGVHIVGGELGDAFIAFSTDEDARQAMMMDGGKIKEIQVKLLLSSRSEMHKVIETARQSVPLLTLAAPAPAPVVTTPAPAPVPQSTPSVPPVISPFSTALGTTIPGFGIPGLGNPQEIPQPAVIEPPAPLISPPTKSPVEEDKDKEDEKSSKKRSKEKDRWRSRSRSRSRDRERKDRKRDRRDRSRSRERRRRDRSRSRDRRDRKRDRKERSRSRDRSPSRRSRDKRNDRRSQNSHERSIENNDSNSATIPPAFGNANPNGPHMMMQNKIAQNGPVGQTEGPNRFSDPTLAEAFNKLQELGKKRNPNAFQGDQNGGKFQGSREDNNMPRSGGSFRRDNRPSRFDNQQQKDCCVAVRNAPNHTSYGDVRRFFPFMIDKHGIKMINDNMGRRTGNIFVRFCDPRSKQLALQRKINELKGSHVIVEALDDETYENAVDSFLPYREENDDTDTNNLIVEENKIEVPFNVLKLSDLPNFVKEHDIVKAFSNFSLLSIQLNDCRITRSKTAIVQFVKVDDARTAYEHKDSYMFGRRQVTITPITTEEFEKEKSSQDNTNQSFLDNRPIQNNMQEAALPRDPRQRRQQMDNGPGTVGMPIQGAMQQQFLPNAQFPQNFGASFQGPQFGGIPGSGGMAPRSASNNNWGNRMNFSKQPVQGGQTGPMAMGNHKAMPVNIEDEPLDCVLMKGLPREATDRNIVNFLADTGAVPARIHLMLDQNGLPSGDCFCEFRSSQEARKAVTKHGQQLDGFRITVDLVMRSVVEEALEGPKIDPQPAILGNTPPSQFMNSGPRGGFMGRGQFRGRGMYDRGGYDRGGFRGGFDQSRGGGFRGRGMWNDRGMRGFDRGRGRGFRGRGGFDQGNMQMPNPMQMKNDDEPDPDLENFGAPGCVVSMENVPFRATVEDILAFFGDFELTQDDVIRRYNERGQPTGDARVAFRTPFDAQRAIKTRHMSNIHDRAITLTIL